jgi:hypothetical protein
VKDFSSTLDTEIAAQQSGWAEIYDIYLKSAITTPWGTLSTLRLTSLPVDSSGFSFFTPTISPEPTGTQGNAATYKHWPMKRELVKSDAKSTNDKMQIVASNVSAEWAQMLSAVNWYDTPVVIRKVPLTIGGAPVLAGDLTADDCAVLFSGQIDSAHVTLKQLQFELSNDAATLSIVAPRENMHTNCRFRFGDDFCTQLKYRTINYKAGTVGNSSTTTVVKSGDFSEDTSSPSSYGTDLVNPLLAAAITASSEGTVLTNQAVTANSTYNYFTLTGHKLRTGDPVTFAAVVMPTGLTAATTYYVIRMDEDIFKVSATLGGGRIDFTTNGTSVTVSTVNDCRARGVRSGTTGYWKLGDTNDWGDKSQGFYTIPDAQAGLANADLKPWIQFDFGSAKTPKVWRISSVEGVRLEELTRLLVIFSSPDASTWTHETYFEMPPRGGVLYEVLIPNASSARYWRICVRSRWAESLFYTLLNKVYAYEDSRHWWKSGVLRFNDATSTAALRGISVRVLESYSGEITVQKLPVAPANGDTFKIQRGCPRTFNACCERRNWENFGGFLDLPYQTVIR